MEEVKFKAGDKVNLKNNQRIVYIYLDNGDGEEAWCLDPNNSKVKIPMVALMHYKPVNLL
jgi:hypothetical protein